MNYIEQLLQPGQIGCLEIKNRMIYGPITFKLGDRKGHLTKAEVDSMLYRAKQKYGPGAIIFPGLLETVMDKPVAAININNDDAMFSLKTQVAQFQQYNVKTIAEIGVLGIRSQGVFDGASHIKYPTAYREMSKEEIHSCISKTAAMARRAKYAGFDAVFIQTIVDKKIFGNFISPYTNKRTDEYGGSTENRARIVIETVKEIKRQTSQDYPVILDLKVDELLGEKGIQFEEGLKLMEIISPYVDAIIPYVGSEDSIDNVYSGYFTKAGFTLPFAKEIKQKFPNIPILAGGKLGNPETANKAVEDKCCDFVILSRPLFVDPQWGEKAYNGKIEKIMPCIGCLNCYTEQTRTEIYPMQRCCTANPANLREEDFYHLVPTKEPKKVLVIGGGLAGIEAASVLAQRGHEAILCEQSHHLGGQFYIASHEEEKKDYMPLLNYKTRVLYESGAKILMNTKVDKQMIQKMNPDVILVAIGALPKELPHQQLSRVNFVQGNDVILNKVQIGQKVVVIGGRFVGLSVATKLALQGKDVSIVDMAEIGKGANPRLIKYYNQKLVDKRVCLYPNTNILDITDQGVEVLLMNFPTTIQADTVVFAMGTTPNNGLVLDIEELNIPYVCIGDCKRIGDALYAIRDGAEIARLI